MKADPYTAPESPGHNPKSAGLDAGKAGVLRLGPLRWLRALGWMIALLLVLGLILSLQSVVKSIDPNPSVVLGMAFICTFLAYAAYAVLVRWGERRAPFEVALRPALREIAAGWAIGVAAMTVVVVILWLTGEYRISPGQWIDWPHDVRETFGTGLLEELLARLVIFRLLMRAFGIRAALVLSAAIFGASHLLNPNASIFSAVAIAVEAGLALAAFYVLTGRIWMSVGVHAGWNLAQGGLFGASVSGMAADGSLLRSVPANEGHAWINGGAFGPEGSLPGILVGLALFLLVMGWRRRRNGEGG